MDILRNLFGNLTATILRLALVGGTLALVYVFAIKPVLDTTEQAFSTFKPLTEQAQQSLAEAQREIRHAAKQGGAPAKAPSNTTITRTFTGLTTREARALTNCVEAAGTSLANVNRCLDRFSKKR